VPLLLPGMVVGEQLAIIPQPLIRRISMNIIYDIH
jgi:hypothetical protein